MKIADIRLTGLTGGTVEGGWADELKPEDDLHTIVEVLTDEGLHRRRQRLHQQGAGRRRRQACCSRS